MPRPLRLVVLISGNGSNLQAIIDRCADGSLPAEVVAVFSNRGDAFGLERARRADIPAEVIDHRDYPDRATFDREMAIRIDHHRPDLVILAGFMRILSDDFVRHYEGRLLNIHPSLLPKYRGLDTHRRVLEAGEREHGCTVHYVIPELDAGPILLQERIAVAADDTPERLAERVHAIEHRLYPEAIRLHAERHPPDSTSSK